jgi:membrane associated rhomboid family serine protease
MFPIRDTVFCKTTPVVVISIIALNAVVFLYEQTLSPQEFELFLHNYALIPARYFDTGLVLSPVDAVPLFTSMFLHSGWFHVIFNMWTLWIFGAALEDRLGHGRFILFYVLCGLAACLAHAFLYPDSQIPVIGASGAVAGVIAAYAFSFPSARLIVLVPLFLVIPLFVQIPAFVFATLWFVVQIMQGYFESIVPGISGIAWWAHISGFLAGLLFLWLIRPAPIREDPGSGA